MTSKSSNRIVNQTVISQMFRGMFPIQRIKWFLIAIIERGKETNADLIMATDPDCDRLGVAAPLTSSDDSEWATFTGNQIGVMLTDYTLGRLKESGKLTPEHYVITTLVTTGMIGQVCKSYGVQCQNNNLVGFKWIGDLMDKLGPDKFVFGTEESHGYLVGQYCRDKRRCDRVHVDVGIGRIGKIKRPIVARIFGCVV